MELKANDKVSSLLKSIREYIKPQLLEKNLVDDSFGDKNI